MTIRTILALICASLLIGSILMLAEASDLFGAVAAVSRGEPALLPEDIFVGTAAFMAAFSISAGVLFWPIAGAIERRNKAAAEKLAADLARFQREGRTRDKARRAVVMRERAQWQAESKVSPIASPHWAGWAGALLAALLISGIAAAVAPGLFPRWLSSRGYEPCEALDATRWLQTRHSRGEIQQSGWALPGDCPTTPPSG